MTSKKTTLRSEEIREVTNGGNRRIKIHVACFLLHLSTSEHCAKLLSEIQVE